MFKIAESTDWKTLPMPRQCVTLPYPRQFSAQALLKLSLGGIPREMEDKWFFYCHDGKLFLHRSWTGFCIFIVDFLKHTVTINRDASQYKSTDDTEDLKLLDNLLTIWSRNSSPWIQNTMKMLYPMRSSHHAMVGDITQVSCDCIVNAANRSLLGGGGVDGAIHRAAGKQLLEECRRLGGCEVGQAKITAGYDLPANYVIHTVGPVYHGESKDHYDLANCYRSCLELARANGIHSIVFPAISTGSYGFPQEKAISISVETVEAWLESNRDYAIRVTFCYFHEKDYDLYVQHFFNKPDSKEY